MFCQGHGSGMVCTEGVDEKCGRGRLAWKENTACLRGREGTRRRSHIQERGPLSSGQ